MKFKTVMIIKAVVCLGFGPLLLAAPGWLLGILGAGFCSGSALTAREYGAALIGNLLLTWLGRNAEASVARNAIIWNLFVYDLIGCIVTVIIIFTAGLSLLAWGIVAVYLFFTITFGYLLLPKKAQITPEGVA